MKQLPLIALVCTLAVPSALSAAAFEGKVTMSLTNSNKSEPQSITMYMREGMMKVQMATERGQMTSIVDFKNRQTILIMDAQRMYMVNAMKPETAAKLQNPSPKEFPSDVQVTTSKETILGYDCTKIVATNKDGTAEIWVTDQLGTFMGMSPEGGGPFGGGRRQVPPQWEAVLKGKDFFPLRVVVNDKKDKRVSTMEVTSVEKAHFGDADFAPPDGYQKFDLGSMFRGAFPGGTPGAPGQPPPANPN
jgi:hypothetical protein